MHNKSAVWTGAGTGLIVVHYTSVVRGCVSLVEMDIEIYLSYNLFDKPTHFFGVWWGQGFYWAQLAQWINSFCFSLAKGNCSGQE